MDINTVLLLVLAVSFIIIAVSTSITARNTSNYKFKEAGYIALVNKDYDKALENFNKVSNNQTLYLKAYTLFKRGVGDDKKYAKELFQEVIDKNLWGKKDAVENLKLF